YLRRVATVEYLPAGFELVADDVFVFETLTEEFLEGIELVIAHLRPPVTRNSCVYLFGFPVSRSDHQVENYAVERREDKQRGECDERRRRDEIGYEADEEVDELIIEHYKAGRESSIYHHLDYGWYRPD